MTHPIDTMLTRRQVMRVGGSALAAYWLTPLVDPLHVRAQARYEPRASARFVIFVMLQGGQSHVDAWDLKEGSWTPPDFDVREVRPGVKWPMGLYPKLAARLDRFSLVRSLEAWDSVHARAQYYVQAAHTLNPALQKEIPPIGSIVAAEYASRRRESDTLPTYVATNVVTSQVGLLKSGFLPATFSPFHVDTTAGLGAFSMQEGDRAEFMRRWDLLKAFDDRLRQDSSLANKAYRDYHHYYESAVGMMSDSRAARVFTIDPADRDRYGKTSLGDGCIIARNLVEADGGTHFVFVNHYDWDHHGRIYTQGSHYRLSRELDAALAALLDDLSSRTRADGRTLLDETLVVCMGEFGRTPGALNLLQGRDHHQYAFTGLFAGGGVKGGRIVGRTDEIGAKVAESGWNLRRSIYMEDVAATIYSAMGIDWKKTITGTPSGRTFYYIEPFASKTPIRTQEIAPLFA
jgi:hypothetical protein